MSPPEREKMRHIKGYYFLINDLIEIFDPLNYGNAYF